MTTLLRTGDAYRKAPAKVAPTRRAVATNGGTSSNGSLSCPIPGTAVAGDLAVIAFVHINSATCTPPAGFTEIITATPDPQVRLRVYTYTVQSGDPGTSKTFTLSNNNAWGVVCAVYADVGGFSVAPNAYISTGTEASNSRPPRCPSIWAGPDDMIVAISAGYTTLSTNGNHAAATGAPTGLSIAGSESRANNILTKPRGVTVADGPGHGPQAEEFTYPTAVHNTGVTLALSPVAPRWSEIEKVPSTLAGKPTYIYGTSSSAYVPRPEINWGYNTRSPWGERIANALGGGGNNLSMPGARAADICTFAYGTRSMGTQSVAGNPLVVNQSGTWKNVADKDALVLTDLIGNDVIAMGTTQQAKDGAMNAARATLALLSSAAVYHWSSAANVAAGSWSTVSSDGLEGGSAILTTTPGDTCTITVSGVTGIDVVLVTGDNTAAGNTGASYSITVDGSPVASGNTHNGMKATGWGANYGFCQMVVPVTLPDTGSHQIVLTHTGSAGHRLLYNGFLVHNPTPPPIVACVLAEMAAGTYTTYGFTKMHQDAMRELLRAVADEFPNVTFYDPSEAGEWDYDAYLASDGVHQNELGHAHYSHEIMRRLSERVA